MVPLGERAVSWVERYLAQVRPRLAYRYESGHLFLTIKGSGMKRDILTKITGKAIREQAKLDKVGACHLPQHSMATQMLENGADTRDTRHIQAILGHEKLETTQIYTRVAIGHLQRVHKKTHPAERKRRKGKAAQPDNKAPD